MCHERSINCVLNSCTPTPARQLNTTNCRAIATFFVADATYSVPQMAQMSERRAERSPFTTSKLQEVGLTVRQFSSYRATLRRLARMYRTSATKYCRYNVKSPAITRGQLPFRSNRCWPVLRSPCSRACQSSRSRFAPRRQPSAILGDSSRPRRPRVCQSIRSCRAAG